MKKAKDGNLGFGKKFKRFLAGGVGLAAVLCAAACSTDAACSADAARPADEIVPGVQFAEGYGIFSAGQAPVYILKEEPEAIETEGAKAWLLSSVYQDGMFRFLVKLEDHSVAEIPGEEAVEHLKQQEEGRFTNFISGAGVPGGRFSADQTGCIRQYEESLSRGVATAYFWYYTENMKLAAPGPEGQYRIELPGFEGGFSIEFVKAVPYPTAADIPGMVIKDGVGILAMGERTEGGLAVDTYTWSDKTYGVTPEKPRLLCRLDGNAEKGRRTGFQANQNNYGSPPEFNKRLEGKRWTSFFYEIPESFEKGDFFLEFKRINLNSNEKSRWVSIPIPEEQSLPNQVAELEHADITIISAEKKAEPMLYKSLKGDGEEESRPCIYLDVETHKKGDKNMHLGYVRIAQEEEDPQDPYRNIWARGSYSGMVDSGGSLVGISAYYEEGDEAINLRFESPDYGWYEEFLVPVQMKD